ncbi:MAG: NgoFVII family restriction endonuclease, partial [Epsilonproteobacteria bacterium]|nr:NgoFVII family restriction endonuclease [Campylobacterota bacterium]
MSSKFFTNQGNNTLENRLKDILSHYRVEYLEFLIGYFRISGFAKIAPYLSNIQKARILVGINVDEVIATAKAKGKQVNLFDGEQFTKSFINEQKDVLAKADYTKDVDESIEILLDMLSSHRLELKISKDRNIHSKIYILREESKPNHDGTLDFRGSVITGSSNLSQNGLESNYEFNVELRDSDDIKFSLDEFERLWKQAIEVTQGEVTTIKEESYLKVITPFELYIKFLIEHFEERIEFNPSVADDLPKGFKKLAY